MATITELNCALRESLESRGVLGQLKARIRAEVFNALDDQSEPRPALSHDNLLINELIREYLEWRTPVPDLLKTYILCVFRPLLYGLLSHFLGSSGDSGGKLFLRGSAPANMTRDPNTLPGPES
uniref:Centrosomal protein 20 n=1 Tax=Oncorhynchus kisutch TaxID=8019 RepID=A0A8C7CRV3_ONCKI